ncbi:hypothetical protein M231_01911 [Tremella mesenterica]|uniref:Uncharacterized protein n=1 Tax=Tremella mesenterica TaxID=5217 RepID=A0A4Q1BSI5_TREME|nr:hypothetical protein M231_01911 [Tremella mesenterica]
MLVVEKDVIEHISLPPLKACEKAEITWSGSAPFSVWIIQSGVDNAPALESWPSTSDTSMEWTVDQPEGSDLTFVVQDNSGNLEYSEPQVVASGSCGQSSSPHSSKPSTPTSQTSQTSKTSKSTTPTSASPTPSVSSSNLTSSTDSSLTSSPSLLSDSPPSDSSPPANLPAQTSSSLSPTLSLPIFSSPSSAQTPTSLSSLSSSGTKTTSGSKKPSSSVSTSNTNAPVIGTIPGPSLDVPKLVAITLGVLAALSLIIFLSFLYLRRRRKFIGPTYLRHNPDGREHTESHPFSQRLLAWLVDSSRSEYTTSSLRPPHPLQSTWEKLEDGRDSWIPQTPPTAYTTILNRNRPVSLPVRGSGAVDKVRRTVSYFGVVKLPTSEDMIGGVPVLKPTWNEGQGQGIGLGYENEEGNGNEQGEVKGEGIKRGNGSQNGHTGKSVGETREGERNIFIPYPHPARQSTSTISHSFDSGMSDRTFGSTDLNSSNDLNLIPEGTRDQNIHETPNEDWKTSDSSSSGWLNALGLSNLNPSSPVPSSKILHTPRQSPFRKFSPRKMFSSFLRRNGRYGNERVYSVDAPQSVTTKYDEK